MGYDSFGNMTSMKVGSRTLMTYAYNSRNGQIKSQTYGNGDKVSYTYDNLGRTLTSATNDGTALSYAYNGEGQLHSVTHTENGSAKAVYGYTYDTLGRLMGTSQTGDVTLHSEYGYDANSRLKSLTYSIPGVIDSAFQSYYYNGDCGYENNANYSEGVLLKMSLFSNEWLHYRYDTLSRLSERDVAGILTEHYTYTPGSGTGTTTTLPKEFYTTKKGSTAKLSGYTYTYDNMGNVTKALETSGNYWAYSYNAQGQLRYATYYGSDAVAKERYYYYYDNAGNLTKRQERDSAGQVVQKEHLYTYGDTNWKDLLTAVDGHSLTYDASGNPLSYYNGKSYTMTWRNGRQLNTVVTGGKTYSYEYDASGLRTRKTNSDGGYTQYFIVDGLTVGEQRFNANGTERYTMKYLLDENNSPVGISIQYPSYASTYWDTFYFAKNLQGDIIAIYNASGALQAKYTYDPYGNITSVTNASGTAIATTAVNVANYNPFRYRGYHYDTDTGFYYLKTRYYDPELGRFISADSFASTGQSVAGFNMFAYCNNNPVNYADSGGQRSIYIGGGDTARNLVELETLYYYATGLEYELEAPRPFPNEVATVCIVEVDYDAGYENTNGILTDICNYSTIPGAAASFSPEKWCSNVGKVLAVISVIELFTRDWIPSADRGYVRYDVIYDQTYLSPVTYINGQHLQQMTTKRTVQSYLYDPDDGSFYNVNNKGQMGYVKIGKNKGKMRNATK